VPPVYSVVKSVIILIRNFIKNDTSIQPMLNAELGIQDKKL